MPENEWNKYERDSRIVVNKNIINSPIEAHIWQMKSSDQVEYLKEIAIAGCNIGSPMPEKFVDWIYWKLGKKIADDYMIPYNQKMFGENLNDLGIYWLDKLPNVSFDNTLRSCLEKKAYGTQPAHAKFYYPKKYGYGEVWLRMADALGKKIEYNITINELDCNTGTVNGDYQGDVIINTIPWKEFKIIKGISDEYTEKINSLKYSSIVIDYKNENMNTKAQWIYYPDPEIPYHRILVRHNFCLDSKGYWTETNLSRFKEGNQSIYYINDYAYPHNTIGKEEIMKEVLDYMQTKNIYGLGRWGEWQHYNSDVVVERALKLVHLLHKEHTFSRTNKGVK